jgi:hypothetical protein
VEIGEGGLHRPLRGVGLRRQGGEVLQGEEQRVDEGRGGGAGLPHIGQHIGEESYIGRWVRVVDAVIADGVYVRDEVSVGRNSSVGPNREVVEDVPEGATLP